MVCRHTSDRLTPCWLAEKLQSHSQEKHWRGLWTNAFHIGAFHYPIAVKPDCRRTMEGHDVNGCYTLQYDLFSSTVENSQIQSQSFYRRSSMEQQGCGKTQIIICPQKFQHLDQYLMKPGHLDKVC